MSDHVNSSWSKGCDIPKDAPRSQEYQNVGFLAAVLEELFLYNFKDRYSRSKIMYLADFTNFS